MRIILFVFGSVFFAGCFLQKNVSNIEKVDYQSIGIEENPEILLLNFEFFSNDSIILLNWIKNPGILRTTSEENTKIQNGDLEFLFYNQEHVECDRVKMANPLIKIVEYSDDSFHLQKKTVVVNQAQFSVRVQFQSDMNSFSVQIMTDDKSKIIKTFNLF